jgi:predicted nucleotidyltransferase
MNIIEEHINDITKICRKHKVKHLYAFGSALDENFNEDSDVDLIVSFDPIEVNGYTDNYFDLKFSLQELLNRPIDLLEENYIRNPFFK